MSPHSNAWRRKKASGRRYHEHGMKAAPESPVVLFDGVCNFCNSSVNFILKRDRVGVFRFAALQSEAGSRLLQQAGLSGNHIDSLVLLEGKRVSVKSTAALRAAQQLPGLWKLSGVFLLVPRILRDWAYDAFAARRYRWFGKQDHCMIPTAAMRSRFLEDAAEPAVIAASVRSNP